MSIKVVTEHITPETTEMKALIGTELVEGCIELLNKSNPKKEERIYTAQNWDTGKMEKIDKAVFLGIALADAYDAEKQEIKTLETAFFITDKGIFSKAAVYFVKTCKAHLRTGDLFRAEYKGRILTANKKHAESFEITRLI